MNEEYVKHLMEQRKGESPINLWFEFVGMMILFGFGLVVVVGIVTYFIGLWKVEI